VLLLAATDAVLPPSVDTSQWPFFVGAELPLLRCRAVSLGEVNLLTEATWSRGDGDLEALNDRCSAAALATEAAENGEVGHGFGSWAAEVPPVISRSFASAASARASASARAASEARQRCYRASKRCQLSSNCF